MGIEAAEKPLVGTPDGDPTVRFSRRTFHPHFTSLLFSFPALVTFLFAIDGVIEVEQSRSYSAVSCKFLPLALLPSRRPNSLSNILEFCHFLFSCLLMRPKLGMNGGNKKRMKFHSCETRFLGDRVSSLIMMNRLDCDYELRNNIYTYFIKYVNCLRSIFAPESYLKCNNLFPKFFSANFVANQAAELSFDVN